VNTTDQQPGQTVVKPTIVLVHGAFAADLPAETTALMAAAQRPVAAAAFSDASGPPAWRRLPSWAVVDTGAVADPGATLEELLDGMPARTSSRSRAHT
jgi:hypothetical protein